MTYKEVFDTVLSNPFDEGGWLLFLGDEEECPGEEYVFKGDVSLRIVSPPVDIERARIGESLREFYEDPYETDHEKPKAYIRTYTIYYNVSRIEEFELASVDNDLVVLPLPETDPNVILRCDYDLARAVTNTSLLDRYIERSGLVFEEDED